MASRQNNTMAAPKLAVIDKPMIANEGIQFDHNYTAAVPQIDPLYVPFGNYDDVKIITDSGKFFPYWIYGLSGNGKTYSIEQAHAQANKKLVLVPITREADEDSLLGGLRLQDGNTVPFYGPVTMAALLGCTVCLDEVDLGDEKLMCLQTPLQNRPFLIKRLGKLITPQPGFNIVATANTKGQGNDDGKFVGTNIMNEAMLDRFYNFFEQDYPNAEIEKIILTKVLTSFGHDTYKEKFFIERLLAWAQNVRELYKTDPNNEIITTRRLVTICRSYDMYGKDRNKAIRKAVARFKPHVQKAFLDCYKLIDTEWNDREKEQKRIEEAKKKGVDPETSF